MRWSRRRRAALASLALGVVAGCGALIPAGRQSVDPIDLEAGRYVLDPDHASLIFAVDHLGFSRFKGRFDRLQATLDFDAEAVEASVLAVEVDMTSLSIHLPEFERELLSATWLDAENHPRAVYRSTAIEAIDASTGLVTGELAWRGVRAPLTLEVAFHGGADNLLTGAFTLGFSARGAFSRSAFGLSYLTPAIGDLVELEIEAEFLLRSDARDARRP